MRFSHASAARPRLRYVSSCPSKYRRTFRKASYGSPPSFRNSFPPELNYRDCPRFHPRRNTLIQNKVRLSRRDVYVLPYLFRQAHAQVALNQIPTLRRILAIRKADVSPLAARPNKRLSRRI